MQYRRQCKREARTRSTMTWRVYEDDKEEGGGSERVVMLSRGRSGEEQKEEGRKRTYEG